MTNTGAHASPNNLERTLEELIEINHSVVDILKEVSGKLGALEFLSAATALSGHGGGGGGSSSGFSAPESRPDPTNIQGVIDHWTKKTTTVETQPFESVIGNNRLSEMAKSRGFHLEVPPGEKGGGTDEQYDKLGADYHDLQQKKTTVEESHTSTPAGKGGSGGGVSGVAKAAGTAQGVKALGGLGGKLGGLIKGGAYLAAAELALNYAKGFTGSGEVSSNVGALNKMTTESQDFLSSQKILFYGATTSLAARGFQFVARSAVGGGVK